MALQTSGPIALSEIQTEFGGSNPIGLSEYYSAASGVPASGTIRASDFYGTSSAVSIEYLAVAGGAGGGSYFTGGAGGGSINRNATSK